MTKRNKKPDPHLRGWLGIIALLLLFIGVTYGYNTKIARSASRLTFVGPSVVVDFPGRSEVSREAIKEETKEEIKVEETTSELIDFYSNRFKVDSDYITCIIRYESRFDTFAKGDSGKAWGLAQFWENTFRAFRRLMGLDENPMLRQDKAEAIKTLAWAISEGRDANWSVVTKGLCRK